MEQRATQPYTVVPTARTRMRLRPRPPHEVSVVADDGAWYVQESSPAGPVWLATFALEGDARDYAERRAELAWRVLA